MKFAKYTHTYIVLSVLVPIILCNSHNAQCCNKCLSGMHICLQEWIVARTESMHWITALILIKFLKEKYTYIVATLNVKDCLRAKQAKNYHGRTPFQNLPLGSGFLLLPRRGADGKGGERHEDQTGTCSHCLSDVGRKVFRSRNLSRRMKMEVFQSMVSLPLWCRDLVTNPTRRQETEDFPHVMSLGHCGGDSVGHAKQCWHIRGDWGATN